MAISVTHFPREIERISPQLARWTLVVLFLWLGAMHFTRGQAAVVGRVFAEHRLVTMIGIEVNGAIAAAAIGMLQLGTGVVLAIGPSWTRGFELASLAAVVVFVVPITLLFTNPVWIDSLGGFPAIGAGQGVLKYVALFGIAGYTYAHHVQNDRLRHSACLVMLAGLLLPLVWIGCMKFTAIEAAGIEPLLASSPLFSWMLPVLTRQGASNVIGATELVTAALLLGWFLRPPWFLVGASLTVLTFLSTLSFIITLPGWHDSLGFPALNRAGMFIIKDLGLTTAAVVLLGEFGATRLTAVKG